MRLKRSKNLDFPVLRSAVVRRSRWERDGFNRVTFFIWVPPILAILALSALLMVLGRAVDFALLSDRPELVFKDWVFVADPEVAQASILATLEILAGVFAISITVVAIIVQLSATRYTSRVVDLFLADKFNTLVFFVYVVPLIYGFWLVNAFSPEDYSPTGTGIFVILATLSILVVFPYFKFVFHLLQPRNIIDRIERSIEQTLTQVMLDPTSASRARQETINSIRQLSDIALSSITQADIVLCLQSLDSIKAATLYYLKIKTRLPEAWFRAQPEQMMGLSQEMLDDIVASRLWMELEIFKQYELAYTTSLRKVRDVNSCVARNLCEIGAVAASYDADRTVEFVIKGFNTLIMHAQSERDVRSAVTVIYQYRKLAEAVLYRPDLLEKIAKHFKYYGHNSQRRRIFFILDAVTYDLRILIETVFERFPQNVEPLLAVFLELDQLANTQEDLAFLRGVRKSQALLGAYFIRQERYDLVKRVLEDMAGESKDFLRSVKRDLFGTTSREFWEIEDRGVSFYYVDQENRESLETFFAWALGESEPSATLLAAP